MQGVHLLWINIKSRCRSFVLTGLWLCPVILKVLWSCFSWRRAAEVSVGVSASFFVSVVIHRVGLYSEGVKNKQQQPKSRFRPDGRRPPRVEESPNDAGSDLKCGADCSSLSHSPCTSVTVGPIIVYTWWITGFLSADAPHKLVPCRKYTPAKLHSWSTGGSCLLRRGRRQIYSLSQVTTN